MWRRVDGKWLIIVILVIVCYVPLYLIHTENLSIIKRLKEVETKLTDIEKAIMNEERFAISYIHILPEDLRNITGVRVLKSIYRYSQMYRVNPELVLKVIKVESNFDTSAVSNKGAIGLMQILPETAELVARYLGKFGYNLYSVNDNLEIGIAYLSLLLDIYSEEEALRRYYAGRYWRIKEAGLYAEKVKSVDLNGKN